MTRRADAPRPRVGREGSSRASDGADPRGAAVASRAGGRPERREERPVDGRGLGHAEREVALGQGPAEERVVEGVERVVGRDHRHAAREHRVVLALRRRRVALGAGAEHGRVHDGLARRGAGAGPARVAPRRGDARGRGGDGGVAAERAGDAVADVDAAVAAAAVGGEERPRPVRVARARGRVEALAAERRAERGPRARPGVVPRAAGDRVGQHLGGAEGGCSPRAPARACARGRRAARLSTAGRGARANHPRAAPGRRHVLPRAARVLEREGPRHLDAQEDLCGKQPVERPVQQKLQTSLARSNRSRFG